MNSSAPDAPRADGAPVPLTPGLRVPVGGLAGVVAGVGMFVTLFVTLGLFASGRGRGFWYPLHPVLALMTGRRVLPQNRGLIRGATSLDLVTGPGRLRRHPTGPVR